MKHPPFRPMPPRPTGVESPELRLAAINRELEETAERIRLLRSYADKLEESAIRLIDRIALAEKIIAASKKVRWWHSALKYLKSSGNFTAEKAPGVDPPEPKTAG